VVCFENRSCAVYNTSDLSAGPTLERDSVLTDVVNRVTLFTAGDSFYVGMFDPTDAGRPAIMALAPYYSVRLVDWKEPTFSYGLWTMRCSWM
jgi:hypothetical protein